MLRSFSVQRSSLVIAIAVLGACGGAPRGATDANLAQARSGVPKGAQSFAVECAGCHGERGESASTAPSVMGPGALPEYPRQRNTNADPAAGDPAALRLEARTRPLGAPSRDPFRTAQDLYAYVSKNMPLPEKRAGSLSPEVYWSIVNFMLVGHGVAVPQGGVNPENAGSVKLKTATP